MVFGFAHKKVADKVAVADGSGIFHIGLKKPCPFFHRSFKSSATICYLLLLALQTHLIYEESHAPHGSR